MTATYSLEAMIAELVSQGYEVTFAPGLDAEPFTAHVDKRYEPAAHRTALGYTARDALAAALPEAVEEALTATAPAQSPEARADRETARDEVWARLDDVEERLERLEDAAGRDVRVLVRCIADLIADDHPGGFVARNGDGPSPEAPEE